MNYNNIYFETLLVEIKNQILELIEKYNLVISKDKYDYLPSLNNRESKIRLKIVCERTYNLNNTITIKLINSYNSKVFWVLKYKCDNFSFCYAINNCPVKTFEKFLYRIKDELEKEDKIE